MSKKVAGEKRDNREKLTLSQLEEVKMKFIPKGEKLGKNDPKLKYPRTIWTLHDVQTYIVKTYEITISRRQVRRYIDSWGLKPYQHETFIKDKASNIIKWFEEQYPDILKQAKKTKSIIFFSDHKSGSYTRYISAFNSKGHLIFMSKEYERLNTNVATAFLQGLKEKVQYSPKKSLNNKKLVFIGINYPKYKKSVLSKWLDDNKDSVTFISLQEKHESKKFVYDEMLGK